MHASQQHVKQSFTMRTMNPKGCKKQAHHEPHIRPASNHRHRVSSRVLLAIVALPGAVVANHTPGGSVVSSKIHQRAREQRGNDESLPVVRVRAYAVDDGSATHRTGVCFRHHHINRLIVEDGATRAAHYLQSTARSVFKIAY